MPVRRTTKNGKPLDGASEAEIAWLSGIIEGEGSIGIYGSGNRRNPRITIGMTDLDVMREVHRIANCGNMRGPIKPTGRSKKESWRLEICSGRKCQEILQGVYRWLGERRRSQADAAMECVYIPNSEKQCEFPDCDGVVRSRGLCSGHRRQVERGEELRQLDRRHHPRQQGHAAHATG